MNVKFNKALKDKSIRYSVLASGLIFLLQVVFVVLIYGRLSPLIPMLNSFPWGEVRLAPREFMFFIPILTLLYFFVNIYFANILFEKKILLSRILSLNILLSGLLSGIALIQIFILVL